MLHAKPKKFPGRSKAQTAALKRVFNGLQVVDAKLPLRFYANARDVKGAVPKDPENCVLARACKRLFDGKHVLFWRSVAYVETESEGVRHVERYVLKQGPRRDIAVLDATGKASPNGYVLNVPSKSQSLDGHRNYQREWQSMNPRTTNPRRKYRKPISIKGGVVRDGRGAVHFEIVVPRTAKRTKV